MYTAGEGIALGDINGDGVLDLVGSGYHQDDHWGYTTVRLGSTQSGLSSMLSLSLRTKADALQAMGMLDRNLENLAKQRGTIGSYQSRVSVALNNLTSSKENFKAAESRIKDADIAVEAAELTRTQIVQQVAASVLAQANSQPQLALTLLQ